MSAETEVNTDRPTWQPIDLEPVLDGTYRTPEPTVGSRDDDVGMFYPGRVHTIASESEGGKTWLALAQAVIELDRGNAATFIDLEDDEGGVVGRLLALGAKRDAIRDRFAYLRPEEPIGLLGNRGDLEQALGDLRPTLAVLDGVTEAMTMHGLNQPTRQQGRRHVRPARAPMDSRARPRNRLPRPRHQVHRRPRTVRAGRRA